jgi:hypothetical protein
MWESQRKPSEWKLDKGIHRNSPEDRTFGEAEPGTYGEDVMWKQGKYGDIVFGRYELEYLICRVLWVVPNLYPCSISAVLGS